MEDEKELKKGQKAYLKGIVNGFLDDAQKALDSIERLRSDFIKGKDGSPSLIEQFKRTETELKKIEQSVLEIYTTIFEEDENGVVLSDEVEEFKKIYADTSSKYRFGYQGSERDNEVSGSGNAYTTHFRELDPRLGRWFAVDPKVVTMPWQSPYNSMDNNPVMLHDPLGDSSDDPKNENSEYIPPTSRKAQRALRKYEELANRLIGKEGYIKGSQALVDEMANRYGGKRFMVYLNNKQSGTDRESAGTMYGFSPTSDLYLNKYAQPIVKTIIDAPVTKLWISANGADMSTVVDIPAGSATATITVTNTQNLNAPDNVTATQNGVTLGGANMQNPRDGFNITANVSVPGPVTLTLTQNPLNVAPPGSLPVPG